MNYFYETKLNKFNLQMFLMSISYLINIDYDDVSKDIIKLNNPSHVLYD